MNIDLNIKNAEEFVLSDKFRDFLMSNTTDFATAAFVLQTLLDKIDEVKELVKEQEHKLRNVDRCGEWEINPDGYYLQCPFCGQESFERDNSYQCKSCGAHLSYRNYKLMEEK